MAEFWHLTGSWCPGPRPRSRSRSPAAAPVRSQKWSPPAFGHECGNYTANSTSCRSPWTKLW